jgi:SAM-dependent methyltransferase
MNRRTLPGMDSVPHALAGISRRFAAAVDSLGATSRGVGWSTPQAQSLRFQALLMLLADHPPTEPFSAFDFGCGYGALWPLLAAVPDRPISTYTGYDICDSMIATARRHHGDDPRVSFVQAALPRQSADYGFVSGTFNYRGDAVSEHWRRYLRATLDRLITQTRRGLAVNFLRQRPPSSDVQVRRRSPGMHYSTPEDWLSFVQQRDDVAEVTLLDDYLDDDFTLLIRRSTAEASA